MDSLTQFALGATISTCCLSKKLGPRKAAILGGALGTLPDLDVFLPFDDPVDSFVLHRGWTHAFAVHVVATPILGELIVRLSSALKDHRWLVWWTVFLCLTTHAIIDAMTVYGTRLFLPFSPDPVGVGSIFIIDPVYTLPLFFVTVWAIGDRDWSRRLQRAVAGALIFSSAYMGLSVVLQNHIETRASAIFAEAGMEPDRVFAIAAPLNTIVWKVIAVDENQYHNLYLSLFDGDHTPVIHSHPRNPELIACLEGNEAFKKLEWFSRGYYRAEREGNGVLISDLRMGLTPNYVFRFAIAEVSGDTVETIPPQRAPTGERTSEGDWQWLSARLRGHPATRTAEVAGTAGTEVARIAAPASCS